MNKLSAMFLMFGLQFALAGSVSAAIRSVALTSTPASTPSGTQQRLVVEIDACRNGYPVVSPELSKISESQVLVQLTANPGHCSRPTGVARLSVIIEDELVELGLDPSTVKIFVQLQ